MHKESVFLKRKRRRGGPSIIMSGATMEERWRGKWLKLIVVPILNLNYKFVVIKIEEENDFEKDNISKLGFSHNL